MRLRRGSLPSSPGSYWCPVQISESFFLFPRPKHPKTSKPAASNWFTPTHGGKSRLSDARQSGRLRSDRTHCCLFACLVKMLPIYVAFNQVIAFVAATEKKKLFLTGHLTANFNVSQRWGVSTPPAVRQCCWSLQLSLTSRRSTAFNSFFHIFSWCQIRKAKRSSVSAINSVPVSLLASAF